MSAFKSFFNKEYAAMCKYAMSYLKDEHLAEDIVQDTFSKMWEQRPEIIEKPEARFYLISAVRNNCISLLRKHKSNRFLYHEEFPSELGAHEELITDTQRIQTLRENRQKIEDALELLPDRCKEVFLAVKLHGLSYKQTAELLKISVKTVENQMSKAIRTFREHFQFWVVGLISIFIESI